jgi:hypothetical protein
MYNADVPPRHELPSARALLRSTSIVGAVAAVLLVAVVLLPNTGWIRQASAG